MLALLIPAAVAGAQPAADEALIRGLLEDGRLEEALAASDRALRGSAGDPQLRFLRGLILARLGRTAEAVSALESLSNEHPELPEPHNNLAVLYAAAGDFDKARDALLQAISMHPSYAMAHENLGDIYARMAQLSYRRASALDRSSTSAHEKLTRLEGLLEAVPASAERQLTPAPGAEPRPTAAEPQVPGTAALAHEMRSTVDAWAAAWAAQDVAAYLGAYASDFRPSGGGSRRRWEARRRARVTAPAFIEIAIDGFEVRESGPDRARVTFEQRYRSDSYRDAVVKELVLVREQGRWLIQRERSVAAL